MASLREAVVAWAGGDGSGAPATPVKVVWGVYDGPRGATWTEIHSDGRVVERRMRPGAMVAIGQEVPATDLGVVPIDEVRNLAKTLVKENFEAIQRLDGPVSPAAAGVEVELTVAAAGESFRVRCPSPLLAQAPALSAIGAAFNAVSGKAPGAARDRRGRRRT